MIYQLIVPKLGDGVEVRVLLWHKREGDPVAVGELLLELETDKAVVTVTAKQPGFLRRKLAQEGGWIAARAPAAWLSDAGDEALPADAAGAGVLLAEFELA